MKHTLLLITLTFLSQLSAQTITRTEILGRPTDYSITIHAMFDTTVEACVQIGNSSGNYTTQTAWQTFGANVGAEILVPNLSADTKYYYRLCYRKPNNSKSIYRPEHYFHTARPKGETLLLWFRQTHI